MVGPRHSARLRIGLTRAIAVSASALLAFSISVLAKADEAPVRVGMEVHTHEQDPSIAADTIVVRYTGPIAYPLAENLAEVWQEEPGRYGHLVLELNSGGGELEHAEKTIAVLRGIRLAIRLTTVVKSGDTCASACIPLYVQGEDRVAAGASVWMFHGACAPYSNIPDPNATRG